MSERMQDRTTGVLIAILIAGAVALVAYAYNHHYGDSSSKKPDHSQSRISSPSGTTNPSNRYYDLGDTDESEDDVYYANCSEARADGAESIREGEPGYREELDRDGDGIACEPWHGR
ncbi:excalibur calcium-binding domain-containing protein [Candidatus Nanosynbacter lyticus]|uniref:excalibur calcium-binding domain-containing protein n=1 Tax=Candidatus Nanosynbacter lyticus TaxID=2093824 RepID=UPI0038578E65